MIIIIVYMTIMCSIIHNSTSPINTCSICLENITKGKKKIECNHEFHLKCIDEWLIKSNTCPLCRTPIKKQVIDVQPQIIINIPQTNQQTISKKYKYILILCFVILYLFHISATAYNIVIINKTNNQINNYIDKFNITDKQNINTYTNVLDVLITVNVLYFIMLISLTGFIIHIKNCCSSICNNCIFSIITTIIFVNFLINYSYYINLKKTLNNIDLDSSYKKDLYISNLIFLSSIGIYIIISIVLYIFLYKYVF